MPKEQHPCFTGTLSFRKSAENDETGQKFDTPENNFLGGEVYDCDFTALTTPGTYTLAVDGIGASYAFKIGPDPVWDAYYHVIRALYHQRSGIRLAPPYTADGYIRPVNQNPLVKSDNGLGYAGKQFYSTIPYMEWNNTDNPSKTQPEEIIASAQNNPLELAGWYHDAGRLGRLLHPPKDTHFADDNL
ncbi:MAG: hypothetical protein HC896_16670 [Bacteroidales bacterium]|nr:hypothetical protein [Bacteroidales bacterium]